MFITGQIKVDRGSHAKEGVHLSVGAHLNRGKLIGIFPEGTRSPDKERMLKAFTGVAQFALRHRVPIIPVGINGTYEVMAKNDKRPTIRRVVNINIGRALHFNEHYGKHSDSEICTRVTEMVMKDIELLSGKVYPHYESPHA